MKTRTQLREILGDIEATIPEARERHAEDEDEFFVEVSSMVQLAVLSASDEDRDWMIGQVHMLLTSHGIPASLWSTH